MTYHSALTDTTNSFTPPPSPHHINSTLTNTGIEQLVYGALDGIETGKKTLFFL